ncbi:hypothetical protein [Thiolapillus sp.]
MWIVRNIVISILCVAGLFSIVASGGPKYVYRSNQVTGTDVDGRVSVSLQALCYGSCKAYLLTILNNTNKDIELDWNKTLYISSGKTSGGFMFEGVLYKDRNNRKPPDIIFPGQEFSKKIYPNKLVDYTSGKYGGWVHYPIPAGENGAYVTLRIGEEEINKRLIVNITRKKAAN